MLRFSARPTTPFSAPRKGLPLHQLDPMRERISCLTSQGGLTGVPQVNLPGATADGAPVGLSIIGARGSDLDLLRVAVAFEAQARREGAGGSPGEER